jgi:flagellar FliJ protein
MSGMRQAALPMNRFHVDNARRQITQLEAMIAEAERMARELEREIRAEEDWAGAP